MTNRAYFAQIWDFLTPQQRKALEYLAQLGYIQI